MKKKPKRALDLVARLPPGKKLGVIGEVVTTRGDWRTGKMKTTRRKGPRK